MGLAEEWAELAQHTPKLVKDGRTGSLARMWAWDGLHRRWVRDDAEAVAIQQVFGLSSTYPQNPLPVVSYIVLQRSVLIGDDPG